MAKRCNSYFRGRGVFIYKGKRCELMLGHSGKHETSGNFLNPKEKFIWGIK